MNPFFDIDVNENLPEDAIALRNLGLQLPWITAGRRGSDFWGTTGYESKTVYKNTTSEDYDKQFINKLLKWKPVYNIGKVIEHHYQHYCDRHNQDHEEFIKHMRYVIFPVLKKRPNANTVIELFEQWLDQKEKKNDQKLNNYTVNNNTINVGNIHAQTQFQQSSDHSVQTQHNSPTKAVMDEAFALLRADIQKLDEQIRKDFSMEMDYAVAQLAKDKDIKSQLTNIGNMISQVGIGMFSSLLAAPVFEVIKPHLGLHS